LPYSGCSIFFILGQRSLNPLDFTCLFHTTHCASFHNPLQFFTVDMTNERADLFI
jgi:hypothetical protein